MKDKMIHRFSFTPHHILSAACIMLLSLIVSQPALADHHESEGIPKDYKLQYHQDFKKSDALKDFVFTDPKAWKLEQNDKEAYLDLHGKSKYKYKVRSPYNIALIKTHKFKSFILDVKMKQTGKEYGHRDMCLFYNFQNRSQYYYTHIATKADKNAHNIFIVNNKDRTNIAKKTTKGFDWGKDKWQHVRIKRDADAGLIEVYVKDMKTPMMVAEDKSFGSGYIGFGSFDDTGRIKDIKIYAPSAEKKDAGDPFKEGRQK